MLLRAVYGLNLRHTNDFATGFLSNARTSLRGLPRRDNAQHALPQHVNGFHSHAQSQRPCAWLSHVLTHNSSSHFPQSACQLHRRLR